MYSAYAAALGAILDVNYPIINKSTIKPIIKLYTRICCAALGYSRKIDPTYSKTSLGEKTDIRTL